MSSGADLREAKSRPSLLSLLFAPDRAMALQAKIGRARGALFLVWLASALLAAALVVRVDAGSSTLEKLESGGDLRSVSDRQISEEIQKAERIFQVTTAARGAIAPFVELGLRCAALLFLCWFLRGRLSGRAVVPVAAAALLPLGLADLLDAASAFQHAAIPPDGTALVPRTIAALATLAGHPLSGPVEKLASACDVFSFWSALLLAFGVAAAGGIPRRRALVGTLLSWVCIRLVAHVAIGS